MGIDDGQEGSGHMGMTDIGDGIIDAPTEAGRAIVSSWEDDTGASGAVAWGASPRQPQWQQPQQQQQQWQQPQQQWQQPRRKSHLPVAMLVVAALAAGGWAAHLAMDGVLPWQHGDGDDVAQWQPMPADGGDAAMPPEAGDASAPEAANPADIGQGTHPAPQDAATEATLGDFAWAAPDWVREGYVPDMATRITDVSGMAGRWKAYLSTGSGADLVEHLLAVDVGGSGQAVEMGLDWSYVIVGGDLDGGGRQDDSQTALFSGIWDDATGTASLVGNGRIDMRSAWHEDGRQYAYATLTWPDGSVGDLYMTRP